MTETDLAGYYEPGNANTYFETEDQAPDTQGRVPKRQRVSDPDTQAALASILAKLIASPATEATLAAVKSDLDAILTDQNALAAKDFATQTTLAGVKSDLDALIARGLATEATLAQVAAILTAGISVSVGSSIGALPLPAGASTEATQALVKAALDTLNAKDFATNAKLEQVRALLAATLTVGGSVSISNFPATQSVSVTSLPLPDGAASEATQSKRYGGGKLPLVAQVSAAGDTTIHTPAAGKAIRVFWVSALNDPDQSQSPLITIKLGATAIYAAYAVAHWEVFDGADDAPLVVNLDQPGAVAVTVHYVEV